MKFSEIRIKDVIRVCGGKTGGAADGWLDRALAGVATDTREDVKGKLFIPIKGGRFDGHDFIPVAFEAGALACLSEKAPDTYGGKAGVGIIYVDSALKALRGLAAYYKSLFRVKTVAVTGSSGKTTTKELIAAVAGQKYETLKTEGNLNNEIGVPKMIFRLEERHEVLILEMGMNHFGEIRGLSMAAAPDMAVITNVGLAHVENLGGREGVLWAKAEVFDGMAPAAPAILNGDDEYLRSLAVTRENIVWYGLGKDNEFFAEDISRGGFGVSCRLLSPRRGLDINVSIPAPGGHMVMNALAAAAAGSLLDVPPEGIKRGIEGFEPCENRMNILYINGYTIINDAYNANPDSMKAALDVLAAQSGFKTAVLGDMLELGAMSGELHGEIGAYAARLGVDRLIAVGSEGAAGEMRGEFARRGSAGQSSVYYDGSRLDAALEKIVSEINPGAVLVKASHGMALERIVRNLTEKLTRKEAARNEQ